MHKAIPKLSLLIPSLIVQNLMVGNRVLALMKNINDNALALMFKMVNE